MDWIIEILEQVKDLKLNEIIFDKFKNIEFKIWDSLIGLKKTELIHTQKTTEMFDLKSLKHMTTNYHKFLNKEQDDRIINEETIKNLKKLNEIFKEHNLNLQRTTRNDWELTVCYETIYLVDKYYEEEEDFDLKDLDDEETINEFIKFVKGLQ